MNKVSANKSDSFLQKVKKQKLLLVMLVPGLVLTFIFK
ncbi:sugar ABC transporter permease [Enterococcus cecorum]|nr:sugar ABC transporter permease [Enterococcus cecorum]